MHLSFCPGERSGVLVVAGDEGVDMRLELVGGVEGRAVQRHAAEDGEPDLNLVEPGRMGRRVMEMYVGMTLQPKVTLRLVGRKIVEDDVDLAIRIVGHDPVHEVEELDS